MAITIPIAKVKVANLREKSQAELTQTLDTYKRELMDLKVQQVAGAAAAKSSKIRDVRRNVARVLTVLTQQARTEVRGQYAKKKYIPKDLRAKKTRALRRALTKNELSRKTLRQQKKEDNFPIREFAIKA
ncbi:60S ribosomal protein L35, L29 [Coemansia linderi]|uniref:60S ribosomal protein L35, L29 n=1 Tax=Coemansia linderi TaxID=2663919 RepID=A0ACC1K940_9FUNG|nr:60S ribosomal protein L35, L29 [Coemansia linderi]